MEHDDDNDDDEEEEEEEVVVVFEFHLMFFSLQLWNFASFT